MLIDAANHAMALVAERLEAMGAAAPWTGEVLDPVTFRFNVDQLGPDLYQGLSGLALSFAAVADATGSPRFERLAHEAVGRARTQLDGGALRGCRLGLEGLGGIAWASHRLWMELASDDAGACLKQTCEVLVAAVARRDGVADTDLIGGEAGALLSILTIVEAGAVAGDVLEATGRRLVDLLLASSVEVPHGRVWPIFDGDHIIGLGHGSSGIMLALHRASSILAYRVGEISAVVDATIAYEDATFDPTIGNWRDPRAPGAEALNCWCYGAAGTRFVRQRIGRSSPPGCVDPIIGDVAPMDHLCCGRSGRLLLARSSGHRGVSALAEDLAARVLAGTTVVGNQAVENNGAVTTGEGGDDPRRSTGLFLGLVGVAYALVQQSHSHSGAADVLILG